ncbi:hypothetical protein PIB30_045139 [Stylosanthes scabra]|uniref:Uncharacterized protein n=1 Tax=Stylosanthes scabra TaxID=79078 RepID=A0ABU6TFS3_9FABA|nr:hypothetical protein [Stylosanthes scabra]
MRPIAPFSPRPAASPSSSASSGSVGSVHRERSRSPRTPVPPMAVALVPGPMYPVPRTPLCDVRRYRSLFSRHRVTPPTPPPPPSPPPSDEEPSAETYDPTADLEGDPDGPYVAERVPYGAPEAYYSDASDGSERESASAGSAPSSHHSSGSSSGSASLGYGSASSGSASDGASDDDLGRVHFCRVSFRVVLLPPVPFRVSVVVPVAPVPRVKIAATVTLQHDRLIVRFKHIVKWFMNVVVDV